MSDSPRPVHTMTASSLSAVSRHARFVIERLSACSGATALASAASAKTRLAGLRGLAIPLALAAVALPADASRRLPQAPAHAHASAHLTVTHRVATSHDSQAHATASRQGAKAAAKPGARNASAGRSRAVASADLRPVAHHGRNQASVAAHAQQAEALATLRQRSSRYAAESHPARHDRHANTAAVEAREENPAPARRGRAAHGSPEHTNQVARQTTQTDIDQQVDHAADQRTLDRVHAWYRASTAAPRVEEAASTPAAAPIVRSQPTISQRAATTADFAEASAVQREAIATARDQQQHQSTADDDNADAESRIPSTAPTEREPAPFQHGSFGADAGGLISTNRGSSGQRIAAPVIRQATGSAAIAIAPPQHVDLKHRGDGLNTALRADADAETELPAMARAPRSVDAVAEETASSATPRLKLPAPPTAVLRTSTPAIAAAQSAARRKDLDPSVATGMAGDTFAEGNAPATANTAIALSRRSALPGAPALQDDESAETGSTAAVPVNLTDGRGRLIFVPPMKGSHDILVHQNRMAVGDGLERIRDDGDLLDLRRQKLLVALPDEESTFPDDRLPANRRYARPWTVRFLRDLARAHYTRFGTPLVVTSAARTVEFQRRLVRVNGNAAPPTGDIASPHLYGQAIDIGKGRMGMTELMWMRAYLTPVENDGKIDVEEEFQQSCFHISVYRRYLGGVPLRRSPATQPPATLLAAQDTPRVVQTSKPEKKRRRISTAMLATGLR